jgi:hypothetical protein
MLDNKGHGPFQQEKVIIRPLIWVTLPRSWKIHSGFQMNLLEPYQTVIWGEAEHPAQVLRDYDNFICEDCIFERIMGSSYDTQ